jgi:hypothetical protein
VSIQPLPELTEAQLKLAGPVHPAGKGDKPLVTDSPVAAVPSFVVNVTLTAALAPTATCVFPEVPATTLLGAGGGLLEPPPPTVEAL